MTAASSLKIFAIWTIKGARWLRSSVVLNCWARRSNSGLVHPPRFEPLQRLAAVGTSALLCSTSVGSPAGPLVLLSDGCVLRSCASDEELAGHTISDTS